MTKSNQQTDHQTKRPHATAPVEASAPTNLSFLYGSIGIQAVAAAARSDQRASAAYRGDVAQALLRKALVEVGGTATPQTRVVGIRETADASS